MSSYLAMIGKLFYFSCLLLFPLTAISNDFYSKGSPFEGIHGNPKNNSYIPVYLRNHYSKVYDTLEGYKVFQPMSFSPDGSVFYVTGHNSGPAHGFLFAVDKNTGKILWQKGLPEVTNGSPIVDKDGKIYVAGQQFVGCFAKNGNPLWRVETDAGGFGMHMDSHGFLLTVTLKGTLYKISRRGKIVDFVNLPDVYHFEHGKIYEGKEAGLANLIGIDGFTANTLAIDDQDRVFIVGKSDKADYGSLIRVKSEELKLIPNGFAYVYKGQNTGATPAISPDNRYIIVSGGDLFSNGYYYAYSTDTLKLIDKFHIAGGVSKGSPAIDPENCVYHGEKNHFDKICLVNNQFERKWGFESPFNISSVYTVTNNQILFQVSAPPYPHLIQKFSPNFSYALGLDKNTGKSIWKVKNPAISMSTIVIDNNQDLYVTMGGGKVGVTKLH